VTVDDENEVPEFPLLMWVPVLAWMLHGLLMWIEIGWNLSQPADPYLGRDIDICFAVVLVPSGFLFIASGWAVVRANGNKLGCVMAGIFCSVFLIIMLSHRATNWNFAMSTVTLLISILITFLCDDAWNRWANNRRGGPRPV